MCVGRPVYGILRQSFEVQGGKIFNVHLNASRQNTQLTCVCLSTDKFLQKWHTRLQGPDHNRILERVNELSQALHQLYSSL